MQFAQEFSLPLISGVVVALCVANLFPNFYHRVVHDSVFDWLSVEHHPGDAQSELSHDGVLAHGLDHHPVSDHAISDHGPHNSAHSWTHFFSLHFLVNELFMVLFFGIAAKEITEACLPGGALNPISRAVNPLFGTIGGVLGPIFTFLLLNALIGQPDWANGWGIPTATDIALAWLAAKFIFGVGHPAITFLLLLAVADDAIGLGIIAIAYPNPNHPTEWINALWIVPGIAIAFGMRKLDVRNWIPYITIAGGICWWGLYSAHLHPALALVFVVPFLPGPKPKKNSLLNPLHAGENVMQALEDDASQHSPLCKFEHDLKAFVDFGLFFFAFANAGVSFAGMSNLTWILLASLVVGKTLGITICSWIGTRMGFPLPPGMDIRHLITAGVIAGIGLTVALFVSGQAFTDATVQGAAKMGSLFSAIAFFVAFIVARAMGIRPILKMHEHRSSPPIDDKKRILDTLADEVFEFEHQAVSVESPTDDRRLVNV
ncbi:MAG TPA: Na+/H+ antiporter NhaA [Pirellulaceae bacterium]|nr:Na+/H+ antiporter NhaA [Pirellulaceae bacterium]HMP68826.1 Na+/H+ antiporter NhaA [Pirellulaceae bacterium]